MRRIAISGAVSVGKTTLAESLAAHLRMGSPQLEVLVIGNVSRDLSLLGRVRPDRGSSPDHYCLYIAEYVRRLLSAEADVVIHDRTLVDTLCYVIANGNASPEFVEMLEQMARLYARDIEPYFYLPIEIPVEADGIRALDPGYRETIDRLLRSRLQSLRIDFKTVRGSADERIRTAADWLTRNTKGER